MRTSQDGTGAAPAFVHAWRLARFPLLLGLLAVEIVLFAPQFSDGTSDLDNIRWGWVLAAIGCEIASIMTYARLRRRLLRVGGARVPLRRMGALTLAATAISATVPAGSAVSYGYLFRQLRRGGASAPLVGWMLTAAAVVSGLSFTVLTMAGALLSGDSSTDAMAGAGGLSVLAVVGLIALLMVVTRHPAPLVRAAGAVCRHLPVLRSRGVDDAIDRAIGQFSVITPRVRDWTAAFWLATLNWVTDLACFVMCCYAVGADRLGLGAAVLAYVAGLATTSISLLPGGLGSVDAGLLAGLTSAGIAAPLALAGVITYRLVAYALFAIVGWIVWAALRRRRAPVVEPAEPAVDIGPAPLPVSAAA